MVLAVEFDLAGVRLVPDLVLLLRSRAAVLLAVRILLQVHLQSQEILRKLDDDMDTYSHSSPHLPTTTQYASFIRRVNKRNTFTEVELSLKMITNHR
jgi:hypothetical protein